MSRLTKKVYATVYKRLQWVGALLLHANLFDKGKQKQKRKKKDRTTVSKNRFDYDQCMVLLPQGLENSNKLYNVYDDRIDQ